MKPKYDIIIIGGGASGMFAAGCAASNGASVLLAEKNDSLGRKLLITGKGRCNLTNSGDVKDFVGSCGKNGKFLYRAFSEFFNKDLINFFKSHGIETKVERGGRIFPVSDDSGSVVGALRAYLKENNVDIRLNLEVKDVLISDKKVKGIKLADNSTIEADKVVIATGGLSYPKTGSTGDGYRMAEGAGHTIVGLKPALVPLETKEAFVGQLQGLALKNICVTVFSNNKKVDSDFGEMLFTHFGLSGPVILKMSSGVVECLNRKEKVIISINLKPVPMPDKVTVNDLRPFRLFLTAGYYA